VLVPDGTYSWIMRLDMIDNDDKKLITGHVTIVR